MNSVIGDGVMEKAFWGMIAGCALAFGVLLTMYLDKAGVIDLSPDKEVENTEITETVPQHSLTNDELYALVYGDEWEEEKIVPDSEEEETEDEIIYTYTEEMNKSDYVDSERNSDHEQFMPESSTQSEDSKEQATEESQESETKKNKEYGYDKFIFR